MEWLFWKKVSVSITIFMTTSLTYSSLIPDITERKGRPVRAHKHSPPVNLTGQFIADQYAVVNIPFTESERSNLEAEDLELLKNHLSWNNKAFIGDEFLFPALVQEFRVYNYSTAVYQVCTDLLSGAAIYAVLGIPYPLYGLATCISKCGVFMARAEVVSPHIPSILFYPVTYGYYRRKMASSTSQS